MIASVYLGQVRQSVVTRLWVPSVAAIGLSVFVSVGSIGRALGDSSSPASSAVVVQGHYVPTDELLTAKAMPRVKSRRVVAARRKIDTRDTTDATWLFDYIGRLIDKEPEAARRVRTVGSAKIIARGTKPVVVPVRMVSAQPMVVPVENGVIVEGSGAVAPVTQMPPVTAPPIDTGVVVVPSQHATAATVKPEAADTATAATKGHEIVTGAVASLPIGRPDAGLPVVVPVTPDASQALVQAAERAQARSDLVKLELSNRTYDEVRMSGQSVFDLRTDWRVLERARDALSGPELAASQAADFEANAYINENTRTIVVAVAGSQDLRRDFLQADLWDALIKSQMPQQFFLAKTYIRSVMQRYQMRGFTTECVGHSLGGGACAYAASELNVRAIVVNPIAAGKLSAGAKFLVTNYVVDGEIANIVYGARGLEFTGDVYRVSDSTRDDARTKAIEKFGPLAGPILVVRGISDSFKSHKVERALDLIAQHAGMERPR